MFIDMHCHAYRCPVPFVVKFCTPQEVLIRYDEAGIEKGVLLPIVSPEIYLPQANEDILEMAQQWPDRFIPWCNIDPRALTNSCDAPLGDILKYYKDKGCKGVGEIMLNVPVLDPLVQNLFKHCEAVGLPVTFDGSDQVGGDFGLYDDPGLPQMEHTMQRFPDLVILAHGPLFWGEVGPLDTPGQRKPPFRPNGHQGFFPPQEGPVTREGSAPKLLRRYPKLYGELSDAYGALGRDDVYGPKFLTEFQDRLFFGTDICQFSQKLLTHELLLKWRQSGKITEQVFRKIAHDNAARFLEL